MFTSYALTCASNNLRSSNSAKDFFFSSEDRKPRDKHPDHFCRITRAICPLRKQQHIPCPAVGRRNRVIVMHIFRGPAAAASCGPDGAMRKGRRRPAARAERGECSAGKRTARRCAPWKSLRAGANFVFFLSLAEKTSVSFYGLIKL